MMDAVRSLCTSGAGPKAAVAGKIKKMECRWGVDGKTDVALDNGTLTVKIDPQAGGAAAGDATTNYLKKKL
jgi:hypothetical protein